jgi:hypothetical protein
MIKLMNRNLPAVGSSGAYRFSVTLQPDMIKGIGYLVQDIRLCPVKDIGRRYGAIGGDSVTQAAQQLHEGALPGPIPAADKNQAGMQVIQSLVANNPVISYMETP